MHITLMKLGCDASCGWEIVPGGVEQQCGPVGFHRSRDHCVKKSLLQQSFITCRANTYRTSNVHRIMVIQSATLICASQQCVLIITSLIFKKLTLQVWFFPRQVSNHGLKLRKLPVMWINVGLAVRPKASEVISVAKLTTKHQPHIHFNLPFISYSDIRGSQVMQACRQKSNKAVKNSKYRQALTFTLELIMSMILPSSTDTFPMKTFFP